MSRFDSGGKNSPSAPYMKVRSLHLDYCCTIPHFCAYVEPISRGKQSEMSSLFSRRCCSNTWARTTTRHDSLRGRRSLQQQCSCSRWKLTPPLPPPCYSLSKTRLSIPAATKGTKLRVCFRLRRMFFLSLLFVYLFIFNTALHLESSAVKHLRRPKPP